MITKTAAVNIAAINYHYKSKEGLIEKFCEYYLNEFINEVNKNYSSLLERNSKVDTDSLIAIVIKSINKINNTSIYSMKLFVEVIDFIYKKCNSRIGLRFINKINSELNEYLCSLKKHTLATDNRYFFWKLHFLVGSIFFTTSNFKGLSKIEKDLFGKQTSMNSILEEMVPFISNSLSCKDHINSTL